MVREHATHADAQVAVVSEWSRIRERHPEASQIMLAYTRRDVAELNALARESLRRAGALGQDRQIVTARGVKQFAKGDRIMFLRNDRSIGVKNGSLGEIEAAGANNITVRLDRGSKVSFDPKFYPDVDHGYAATIHKSQGVTVDSSHVLATSHMDRQAANVAMTRHRDGVFLHYGRDAFSNRALLTASLGRDGSKDVTLDYLTDFAERHGGIVDRSFDDRQRRFFSREPSGVSPGGSHKTSERARGLGDDRERSR